MIAPLQPGAYASVVFIGTGFKNWKYQSGLALAVLLIPLLAQCGGQIDLVSIEQTSGGAPTTSTSGSTGVSGSSSTGGTTATQLDSGYSCRLPASDLDYSCSVDSDCVAVPGGDPCSPYCAAHCLTGAVNSRVAAKYTSDFSIPNGGSWKTIDCFCTCVPVAPCCRQGTCYNSCDMCNQLQ